MKNTLQNLALLFVIMLAVTACGGPDTEFEIGSAPEGIEISYPADDYDEWKGYYTVAATVKNTTDKHFDIIQLTTTYRNAAGDSTGFAIGGKALAPGDSAVIQTGFLIPNKEELPAKVVLSATDFE